MSAKHTPGPWDSSTYEVEARDGTLICNMSGWRNQAANKANASLIAAAPELLEALKVLVERIEYYASLAEDEAPNIEQWAYTEGSSDVAKARAAIAKAEGKS